MEAAGATAAIVGIVSFGLGLAISLRAFIHRTIEAEDTIKLNIGEIEYSTQTLKDINDLINQDKASNQENKSGHCLQRQ